MTNGNDRLDRVECILEELAVSQRQFQEQVAQSHRDFAARQQYQDEAFGRHDAEMKKIRDAIAADRGIS
jgi:hypothetical protein